MLAWEYNLASGNRKGKGSWASRGIVVSAMLHTIMFSFNYFHQKRAATLTGDSLVRNTDNAKRFNEACNVGEKLCQKTCAPR